MVPAGVNGSQVAEMITELNRSAVQPSQTFAGNTKNFATRLLPVSGAGPPGVRGAGSATPEGAGAHAVPNTAPAFATTPTPTDLGVIYGGRDRLLRVGEVAEQLGVSTATVYKLCKTGRLPHVRIVDSVRVRPTDLAAFVEGRLVDGGHRPPR